MTIPRESVRQCHLSREKDTIFDRATFQNAAVRRSPELTGQAGEMSLLATYPVLQHQGFSHIPVLQAAWAGKSFADVVKAPAKPVTTKAAAPAPVAPPQITISWVIYKSARGHYGDGWGAALGITSDAQLKAAILGQEGNEPGNDTDWEEVYLGDKKVKGVLKGCNILYSRAWSGNTCTITVWHCGPTKGAG